MARQEARAQGNPLSTLLIAWTVVVGLAFAPVGTWYYRSQDIRIMIAFLGAAFIIGVSLFASMGLARMGARSAKGKETDGIADLRARGALWGRR